MFKYQSCFFLPIITGLETLPLSPASSLASKAILPSSLSFCPLNSAFSLSSCSRLDRSLYPDSSCWRRRERVWMVSYFWSRVCSTRVGYR
jgi:hypothetical protein